MAERRGFGHTGAIMNDIFLPASLFTQAEPAALGLIIFVGCLVLLCGYRADRRHER